MKGLLTTYRTYLPITPNTPALSLGEGDTPLVAAPAVSHETGAEVWLKLEGCNPTGSFKDRGMVVAVAKAVEEKARAVICASTGNTAASAAAYAARAGLTCAVVIPSGTRSVALGKLSQAIIHHARVLPIEGNFDRALKLVRDLAEQGSPPGGRLSIIDLSARAHQPMSDPRDEVWVVLNGEIYNYRELRAELRDYQFRTQSDTEVLLAAYEKWGENCLDRMQGMFAFILWDRRERKLFAARDRFGVKPLYYHQKPDSTLYLASEIRAFFAADIRKTPDPEAWATYLVYGLYDHLPRTFWMGIQSLPPGHKLIHRNGKIQITCWYDLAKRVGEEYDARSEKTVGAEYLELLDESMRLRFRSDVPVGVNISGGLDSSIAIGLIDSLGGKDNITAFTYVTGDPRYDELPWVREMLAQSAHPLVISRLHSYDVPALAASVQLHQSEPFGGIPTLAYARLFELARAMGVIVLCDGQGLDEQWAGYDYYRQPERSAGFGPVQGSQNRTVRPDCLVPEFAKLAQPFDPPKPFPDALRNRQYFDTRYAKIPRALRFNDRISSRVGTELREPFMDHRLFELAFRQPPERKIRNGTGKWLLREVTRGLLPRKITLAPKRAVQTPQREWLRRPLHAWSMDCIQAALLEYRGIWMDAAAVRTACREYAAGSLDNSFFLWQWISLGLVVQDLLASRNQKNISRDGHKALGAAGAGRKR